MEGGVLFTRFPSTFAIVWNKNTSIKDAAAETNGERTCSIILSRNLNNWEMEAHMNLLNFLAQVSIPGKMEDEAI